LIEALAVAMETGNVSGDDRSAIFNLVQQIINAKQNTILVRVGNDQEKLLFKLLYRAMPRDTLYDRYLNSKYDSTSLQFQTMEECLLTQLKLDKLREPEVIAKILKRVANGDIQIKSTDKGLGWFVEQQKITPLELMKILQNNFDYFITKDGEEEIRNILTNIQFINPLRLQEFDIIISQRVIEQLNAVDDEGLDPLVLQEVSQYLVDILQNGTLLNSIDQQVKDKIKALLTSNDEVAGTILSTIKNLNICPNDSVKGAMIKQALQQLNILEHLGILENKEKIAELVQQLLSLDIEQIKRDYIKKYVRDLPFNNQERVVDIIHKYLKWSHIIEEEKKQYYVKLQEPILDTASRLSSSPRIQSDFILNCLPFISYSTIKKLKIENTVEKNKCDIILKYCQGICIEENHDEPVSIMVTSFVGQEEPVILQADNCFSFNPLNIPQGVGLNCFKIVQVSSAGITSEEITPEKLQNMKLYSNFKKELLSHFTYKNIIHKILSTALQKYIQKDTGAKLSKDQIEKMIAVFYEIITRPLDYVPLTVDWKKQFINALEDGRQLTSEHEDHINKQTIPAGEFITMRQHLLSIQKAMPNEQFLEKLPDIVQEQTKKSLLIG